MGTWDSLLEVATYYRDVLGVSVIPITYKSKIPDFKKLPKRKNQAGEEEAYWDEYQKRPPTDEELQKWFKEGNSNIAIICGEISRNLVIMDFETQELYQAFFAKSKELEQKTIIVKTSKGYHVYLRSKKPMSGFAVNNSKGERLLDIKSTGSYCLAPPSTHPSGIKYEFISQRLEILEIDDLEVLIKKRLKQLKENNWDLDIKDIEIEPGREQAFEESNLFEVLPSLRYCFKKAIEENWDLRPPGKGFFKLALLSELIENGANDAAIHQAFSKQLNYNKNITQKRIENCKRRGYLPFKCETIREKCKIQQLSKACEECQKIEEKEEEKGERDQKEIEEEEAEEITIIQIPPIKLNLPPDNFIVKYLEFGKSITDAYPEYHFAAAISLLSTAANRNLVCKLKHEEIYPNIWFFCLGDSTISRKTTAMRIAKKILNEVEILLDIETMLLPQAFSPEAFIEELSEKPRGALWRDEAAGLLAELQKPYMLDMRDLFCQIYENQGFRRKLRTNQRKNVKTDFKVKDPYVTQWLLTTPDNFKKHAALLDVTSGWLVRYLYLAPDYIREWKPYREYTDEDAKNLAAIVHFLEKLFAKFQGENSIQMKLSKEGWDFFENWQREREKWACEKKDRIILAILGRLETYAIKLAMLFQLGQKTFTDEISIDNLREACRLIDGYFLPTSIKLIKEVGWDEEKNLIEKILGTLYRAGGELDRRRLLKALHRNLDDVNKALQSLVASGEIEIKNLEKGKKLIRLRAKTTTNTIGFTSLTSITIEQENNEICNNNSNSKSNTTSLPIFVESRYQEAFSKEVLYLQELAERMKTYADKWQRERGVVNSLNISEFLVDFLMQYYEYTPSEAREMANKIFGITPNNELET